MTSFLPQFQWLFSISTILEGELIWNCCKLNKERLSKNRSTFRPTFKSFFSEKVSAGPIGFLAKYENVKGISKIHLSLFRHFVAFLSQLKNKKVFVRKKPFLSVRTVFKKWNSFSRYFEFKIRADLSWRHIPRYYFQA